MMLNIFPVSTVQIPKVCIGYLPVRTTVSALKKQLNIYPVSTLVTAKLVLFCNQLWRLLKDYNNTHICHPLAIFTSTPDRKKKHSINTICLLIRSEKKKKRLSQFYFSFFWGIKKKKKLGYKFVFFGGDKWRKQKRFFFFNSLYSTVEYSTAVDLPPCRTICSRSGFSSYQCARSRDEYDAWLCSRPEQVKTDYASAEADYDVRHGGRCVCLYVCVFPHWSAKRNQKGECPVMASQSSLAQFQRL